MELVRPAFTVLIVLTPGLNRPIPWSRFLAQLICLRGIQQQRMNSNGDPCCRRCAYRALVASGCEQSAPNCCASHPLAITTVPSDQSPFDLLLLDGQLDPGVLPREVLKLPTVVFVASRRRAACCDDEQCDGSNIAYPGHAKTPNWSVAVVGMIVQLVRSTIASRSYVTIRWWHAWMRLEGWSRDGLSKTERAPYFCIDQAPSPSGKPWR